MSLLPMEAFENQKAVLQEFGRILYRQKWVILLFFLAAILSTYGTLQMITNQYTSEARLLIKLGRENAEVPVTVDKGGVFTTGVRKEEVNSNIQLLTSRNLVEAAVDRIGIEAFEFSLPVPQTFFQKIKYHLKTTVRWCKKNFNRLLIKVNLREDLADREKIILLATRSLSVAHEKDSDVISLQMKLPNPELAKRFLNELIAIYFIKHIEVRQESGVLEFFEFQYEDYKNQMASLENERWGIHQKYDFSSIPSQRDLLLRRIEEISRLIDEAENEKMMLDESQQGTTAPPSQELDTFNASEPMIPNPSVEAIKNRITVLRIKRLETSGSYDLKSKEVLQMNEEIAKLESLLKRGVNAKLKQFYSKVAGLEQRLDELDTAEKQLRQIDLEIQIAQSNYLTYAKRREEARITNEMDRYRVSNVALLSPPSTSIEPVYPRKMLITYISIPLALLLGIGLALLLEYFDDSIRTRRDLQNIQGLPFLGTFRMKKSK